MLAALPERRIAAQHRNGQGNFVNIHLLVSPDDPNHVFELNRFLGRLVFSGFSDKFACTPEDLRRLGRLAGGATLDDEAALRHGAGQFKVSLDNLLESYRDIAWAQDNILVLSPRTPTARPGVKEAGDATLREEIEKAGHLMFASSAKQRDFWLGRGKASPAELLERYGGLKPCIWGCDAHELARVGKPDEDRLLLDQRRARLRHVASGGHRPGTCYVGAEPPDASSRLADHRPDCAIENAPWAQTPLIHLNPRARRGGRACARLRQDSARRHDRDRLRFLSALRAPIVPGRARPDIWRGPP